MLESEEFLSALFSANSTSFFCGLVLVTFLSVGCSTTDDRYYTLSPTNRYYRVMQGDTLYGVAKRVDKDYRQLAKWNGLAAPYTIKSGTILRLFSTGSSTEKQRISTDNKVQLPPAESKNKKKLKKFKNSLKVFWDWPIKGVIAKNYSQTGRKGLDIVGKYGEPVRAAATGKILYAGQGLIGYGNLLILKHNEQYFSAYGNNSRLLVKEGDIVQLGQAIAEVGVAANKRPILHFEIRKDGNPVDPIQYLPKP